MSAPASIRAVIAASRFGFAARAGELDAIARDPEGWVLQQIRHPARPDLPDDLPASSKMVALFLQARRDKKLGNDDKKEIVAQLRAVYLAEVDARMKAAVNSDTPLIERLTHFWSNHFTVSGLRPQAVGVAGAFEREAIRPHVLGRFDDLLVAAERHPAMLLYLDNAESIGPDSPVGQRRDKGLNENLGRETLELHTLGVDGGYSQADVEALARILTGWSVARLVDPDPGAFHFYPQIHEPGSKQLLGRTYTDDGYAEGERALRDLAQHPATARHIAVKLARHFIADDPPKEAVTRLARVFDESGGDLKRVTAALVVEDSVWRKPFAKMRAPGDMVTAACRASGFIPPANQMVGSLRVLDQPAYFAPSPAGWPDDAASWVSPEAVLHRAEWCETYAAHIPDPPDPATVAEGALGDSLPNETMEMVRRAPSRRAGLALALASPEFQRR